MTGIRDHGRASARPDRRTHRATCASPTAGSPRSAPTSTAQDGDEVDRRRGLRRQPRLRRPARPSARARQGGGRDDRDRQPGGRARRVHRRRGDAQHRPDAGLRRGRRLRPPAGRPRRAVRGAARGGITVGRHGEPARPVRRARRGRRADLHRRRQRRAGPAAHAAGVRVLARARHHARPALRGRPPHRGCRDARRGVLQPARPAGMAVDRRGADGPSRHRAGRGSRAPASTSCTCRRPAASSSSGAAKADGLPVTAEATPHHFSLTDELLAGYDADVQGQPAAAHASPTSTPSGRGSPTARSTRSPPTTRRTPARPRSSRSTRRRPGCSGSRPSLGVSLAHLDMPLADVVAALSWKPAAIAGVADRHGRPIERGGAGEPHGVRSRRRVGGRAGPPGEQEPQHARSSARRCAAGSATRSSTAARRPRRNRSPSDRQR